MQVSVMPDIETPKASSFDVVVAGGGIMGSCIAYYLAQSSDFKGSVLVVERDPTYSNSSTTRSVGSIRQQFSTKENIFISQFGFKFLTEIQSKLQVDENEPDIGFVHSSYLVLATADNYSDTIVNHEVQLQCNCSVERLEVKQLISNYEWMNSSDLVAGYRGLDGEGWFDPYSLLTAIRRKAIQLGVQFTQDEVVSIDHSKKKVDSIGLVSGQTVHCGYLVNAAGPYAGKFAGMADCTLPVEPRKRQVFVFECPATFNEMPLVIDPAGIYFRPEGKYYICGYSPQNEEPDEPTFSLDVDYLEFENTLWPLLAHRVPAFESIRMVNAWAGHYDYNTFDQNGIVGFDPSLANFIYANGFSGHGLQQGPAIGRAVSELIVYGEYKTLDLSSFSFARLLEHQKKREQIII